MQQGGGYGIHKFHTSYKHALKVCDYFLCFHKEYDKKHIRVTCPYFITYNNTSPKKNISIISQSRLYFMHYKGVPEEQEVDIEFKFVNQIIDHLNSSVVKYVKIKSFNFSITS